uniref:Uncharacterized protein n=1 Tax=Panagrolaimus davidi TaxID=227884 RepID=A0A914QYI9_9BILA
MLKKLAVELNKLRLCMAKARVLALVHDVGFCWLDTSKDVTKESEAVFDFVHLLKNVLKKYECEFILDHYSVVVVEKTLYEDGAEDNEQTQASSHYDDDSFIMEE